jgi:hypothetical protein
MLILKISYDIIVIEYYNQIAMLARVQLRSNEVSLSGASRCFWQL